MIAATAHVFAIQNSTAESILMGVVILGVIAVIFIVLRRR